MKARIVRLACRIYAVMVRAYPSSFRREYSREMMLVFEDRARDVAERAGGWAVLPFMLHITCDWLLTMVREGVNLPIHDPTGVVLRTLLNCAIVVAWVQVTLAAYLWVAGMWLNARTPTSGLLFEFLVPFGAGLCLLWCVGGAAGGWIATRRAGRDRALIGVASALAQLR
jgi:hypothetical protein